MVHVMRHRAENNPVTLEFKDLFKGLPDLLSCHQSGRMTGTLLFTMGQRTATDEIHFQPHEVQRHWLEWCVCVFIQEHVDLMSVRRLAQYGSDASR